MYSYLAPSWLSTVPLGWFQLSLELYIYKVSKHKVSKFIYIYIYIVINTEQSL